ncbi:RHS repeat protein [Propioniciclava tarda]|uniref:RHS repeat-associated core domain-containing protein n=1 Tax=Propioniciclava tarda TaxID=433330 RepID=A0A4Q9KL96_PROTD|nr:RHS repeat protein [Propioniciclava tarda]TBT95282.1 hypothetical protein ET996_05580 [Propioniciclava tarda]SMO60202.1 RHS repeat-associated core domain-containing protein [Propioniciclava tarda]
MTTTVAGVASTVGYSWRDDGQMTAITLDGVAVATLGYDPAGELAGVTYPFGGLGGLTKQPSGALVGDAWTVNLANGASRTFTESLTRSQAGRVTASSWTDTGSPGSAVGWGYSYDQAGRLTQAVLAPAAGRAQTSFGYSFTPTGGCGADPQAGKNGSRTGSSIQTGAGTPQVTSYCYDQASRLTATTGANPIDPGTVSYDPHGNATRIGDQTWTYNAADQVTGTTVVSAGQQLGYTRDPSGRVVQRQATGPETATARYGFAGGDDSPDLLLDPAGQPVERYLSLPGGVLLTKPTTGAATRWAVPNLHGDTSILIGITNGAVTISGAGWINDPYGQPINPNTGQIDLAATPTTRTGTTTTDAWLGQHQRGFEHTTGLNQMLMGARTYLPSLGIFTATDPVEGGNDTTYTYPNDPINKQDLSGEKWWNWWRPISGLQVARRVLNHGTAFYSFNGPFVSAQGGVTCIKRCPSVSVSFGAGASAQKINKVARFVPGTMIGYQFGRPTNGLGFGAAACWHGLCLGASSGDEGWGTVNGFSPVFGIGTPGVQLWALGTFADERSGQGASPGRPMRVR